jgi:hypothetical protein
MNRTFFSALVAAAIVACSPKTTLPPDDNPPAPGFRLAQSDPKAVAIADEVMRAMGGRKAWDEARTLSWNFFGRRKLLWDKHGGQCRIEWLNRALTVQVNLNDGSGQVWMDGAEQTQADTLAKYLDLARKVWINDSYWLVMPFKLKDSGVTLRYLGQSPTEAGEPSDLLQLTFENVGVTPDNKYHVWVDQKTRLVTQWAYFEKFGDEKPRIVNAWGGYQRFGKLLIATERGSRGSLAPVEVGGDW